MILLIDNYDSFVWNLAHYLGELGVNDLKVIRNDQISISEIVSISPAKIILSPGPCTPNEAGICLELVKELYQSFPILGICLGHQVIGQSFGAKIIRAKSIMHGKVSNISHNQKRIFSGLPSPLPVMRYHSLAIDSNNIPDCLCVTATTTDGEIMAIEHRDFPTIIGLQFHPESIMTKNGKDLLKNYLNF